MLKLFKFLFLTFVWLAIIAVGALFYYFQGLPSLDDLEKETGKQIVQINYANGNRLTNRGEIYTQSDSRLWISAKKILSKNEDGERGLYKDIQPSSPSHLRQNFAGRNRNLGLDWVYTSEVSYYELPQHLIHAVVATEDRRFFSHHGIDIFGIIRAYHVNQKAGRIVQGGSTITQQLAKLLFLNPEKTFERKIQEVLLALQLERRFTKEQILTFYLNRAYFGAGNNGVAAAAKSYFGKNVANLSLNESALLAGVLKAPSKFSPKNNRELAESRAGVVLRVMIDAGFLNEKNISEINQEPHYIQDHAQRLYFADFVYDQLSEFLGKKEAKEKVISVVTTLDESLQARLEEVLNKFVKKRSQQLDGAEIAVVVMNKTGAVLAMSGGRDHQQSQFNRAAYAKRQAGSAFKTFVYLAAFTQGATPDDIFTDKKVNVGAWLPDNYNSQYLGEVTLRRAFAESLNSVAIQLAHKVGGKAVAEVARDCGITSVINKNDLTIALGTAEVSLLELTAAYATIANDGYAVIPYAISEIQNEKGDMLYKRESSGLGRVVSEDVQQKIKEVLHSVVTSGTGKNANVSKNIFGKTGTSQNFRDAWFVGFDDDYVIGVWMGNDNNQPTKRITGGSLPAELWGMISRKS
ncbi:MAG: PBP1A family penicillin-binding protein [Alphaproteobacteria bacterium]|nr:PBP1A family penicillin-binding protein [Alphaproteobacteria bacterium]